MLNNVIPIEDLGGLARARARGYETKTVNPALVDSFVSNGWTVDKRNRKSVRLRRPKSHGDHLEDRVWILFYRMQFPLLSGKGGAELVLEPKNPESPTSQIDVASFDNEIAIAIECKSSENPTRRPQFQNELAKHGLIRERFTACARTQFPALHKRQVVLAMFLSNILLSDNDRVRAKDQNIILFDDHDLEYYEQLVSHIGPAARYQFLADMLPGKTVPGLELRLPAIKIKIGGFNCYSFSITPEYLLKVSYVSHRSKGKRSDVSTYQRMLSKSRLNKIKRYITDDGIFPTNIVVNIDKNRLQFERIHQEGDPEDSGIAGWLNIRPTYKSAWIIDGQHRLFAYSGHDRASKSRLSVLAFDGLAPSEQARLFIDINAKQKSVKQSLLQELYAELHWDADDDSIRTRAIISKTIQDMDRDPESPLYQRIQTADAGKDDIRCISLTSLYGAIEKAGFHVAKEKKGHILEYGPLWAGENDATLKRTEFVLNQWLNTVRIATSEWWGKGAGEGGGLAMNDGVITCINVLRSVLQHLESKKLIHLDHEDLFEVVKKYAVGLGAYLGSFSEEGRRGFRDLRGIQGQTRRTRNCQQAIRQTIPEFNPPGLDQFIQQEKAQTNIRGKEVIDRIERMLQSVVLEELRRECGEEETGWWMIGVPKPVRLKVSERFEQDEGKRGGKENYFDLIDYAKIGLQNWELFEPILAYEKAGKKESRIHWLNIVNEKRNIVSHPSAAITLTVEDLAALEEYERWLKAKMSPTMLGGIDITASHSQQALPESNAV
jgi:DNA sulfur modification protein DndB